MHHTGTTISEVPLYEIWSFHNVSVYIREMATKASNVCRPFHNVSIDIRTGRERLIRTRLIRSST